MMIAMFIGYGLTIMGFAAGDPIPTLANMGAGGVWELSRVCPCLGALRFNSNAQSVAARHRLFRFGPGRLCHRGHLAGADPRPDGGAGGGLRVHAGLFIMSHWEDNEQHGHLFGYWFGHDMFTPPFKGADGKPIYPEMDRDTVLFGGTDPGRFNPTYMIFCESFIPADKKPHDPNFDRRDVYLITQNALADGTYLNYIRAHYNRSTEIDPPFFSELLRGPTNSAGLFDQHRRPLDGCRSTTVF